MVHLLTSAESDDTLHTAEDAKTLIRAIIDGSFVHLNSATSGQVRFIWMLHIAPAGVNVITISTTQSFGNNAPLQLIAHGGGQFSSASATAVSVVQSSIHQLFRDTKAMRKMKAGDLVKFTLLSDGSNEIEFVGTVDLWFKE